MFVAWGTILPLTFNIWLLLLIPVIETLLAKEDTDKVPIVAVPVTYKSPLALIFPEAVIWPFISTRGAVISNVVPALISKWPFAEAIIFSPPAASWNDNLLSPVNTNSSADSSQSKYCPEVAPKNLTSWPVSSTPTVNAPTTFTTSKLAVPSTYKHYSMLKKPNQDYKLHQYRGLNPLLLL